MSSAMSGGGDVWSGRRRRTVRVTLDPTGKPYGRGDFVRRVETTVGLKSLEAVGPTQDASVWELTFTSIDAADYFVQAGDFSIRDMMATVQGADNQSYRLRLHWIPYYVSNDVFVEALEAKGVKVVSAEFDCATVKGLEHVRTGIRTFTVTTSRPAEVPHLIPFVNGHEEREALVTMSGRLPLCLRCKQTGHVRQQCNVPFCWKCRTYGHKKKECKGRTYASAASGKPAPHEEQEMEDEDDEQGKEPPTATAAGSNPAPSTSTAGEPAKDAEPKEPETDEQSQPPTLPQSTAGDGAVGGVDNQTGPVTSDLDGYGRIDSQWSVLMDQDDQQRLEVDVSADATSSATDGFEDAVTEIVPSAIRRRQSVDGRRRTPRCRARTTPERQPTRRHRTKMDGVRCLRSLNGNGNGRTSRWNGNGQPVNTGRCRRLCRPPDVSRLLLKTSTPRRS